MNTIQKVLLSYVAFFGGAITLLTVNGHWKKTEEFLNSNPKFGFFVTAVYLFSAYVYYDSADKAAKLEFDKRRQKRKNRNTLGHRK